MDVEDLVKSYFRLGFSNKKIICLLAHQHGVIISKRTLQRLCRKLNLFRRKNQLNFGALDVSDVASTSAGVPKRCGIMAYSETSSAPKFNSYSTVFISL